MTTIPASQLVSVQPNVLSAGGTALDLVTLVLTTSAELPYGVVQSFPNALEVEDYFGAGTDESNGAAIYFNGFDNSNKKPGNILFTRYPLAAVSGFLRGASLAGTTLTQLQALPTDKLTVAFAGTPITSTSAINLSSATSFSNAATIIQASFTSPPFTVTYDSLESAFVFTSNSTGATQTIIYPLSIDGTGSACTTSGTTLTVGGTVAGKFAIGDAVAGSDGTNSLPAGCKITAILTGTGGAGTYTISAAASPGNLASSAVTATGPNGAMVTSLKLSQVTGAILSQGQAAATPGAFMDSIVQQNQNWATLLTAFNPDTGGANTQKLAFAAWVNNQNDRYAYLCWDTDITPTQSVPATGSLGYILQQNNSSGTMPIWEPSNLYHAWFVGGMIASIDFSETNGRITLAFKGQTGLALGVTDVTVADNLAGAPQGDTFGNGYNFYGGYATADQQFQLFQRGTITGPFQWADSYVNQIWLNNFLQSSILNFMASVKSFPYNQAGYALLEAAIADPVNAGLNFGAIVPGVTLSASQIAAVNNAAGKPIANTLSQRGWYLQVSDAAPTVRAQRGSPPCTLWYCDGGSIQAISLASILVQ